MAMTEHEEHEIACPGAPVAPLVGLGCPSVDDERIALMGLLVEAASRITRTVGVELERASGLPLTWFDVLIRVSRAADGRLTMTELAAETRLTSGGVTRLVDRIVEAGFVERQSCPTDRRTVYVALTDAGRAKFEEATAVHLVSLDRHLMAPLSEADRAALRAALPKLIAGPGVEPG